jgi:hypothetical protein
MRKPVTRSEIERSIKRQVQRALKAAGWKFWMPTAGIYGRSGVSDFLVMKKPRLFMAIETKYKDVVTPQQFKFLADVDATGHYAFLVDETNIAELPELLANLDNDERLVWARVPFMKWVHQDPAKQLDNLPIL